MTRHQSGKSAKAADHLDAAVSDLLGFKVFPKQIWKQIWSNHPQGAPQQKKSVGEPMWSGSFRIVPR
ncbi:mobile element protein [Rhodococcus aetherivorans]|uniref:Mobile element protein n=1 Tax=Rhodococcus aetherivorans TaxID=191292 RepID=A0ABQ0YJW9_9NOCA|nr:mobile element protein [Rhodococcus aetherivorans]